MMWNSMVSIFKKHVTELIIVFALHISVLFLPLWNLFCTPTGIWVALLLSPVFTSPLLTEIFGMLSHSEFLSSKGHCGYSSIACHSKLLTLKAFWFTSWIYNTLLYMSIKSIVVCPKGERWLTLHSWRAVGQQCAISHYILHIAASYLYLKH